jgi:hypothetical protein
MGELYTPLTCWGNVRDTYCRQHAPLYQSECDAPWFLRGPCVYDDALGHKARRWESLRFSRAACDWLWCAATEPGHLAMRVAPWDDANTTEVNVLATKCRRTPYKYPDFESLW